jgi:hypothetical protein
MTFRKLSDGRKKNRLEIPTTFLHLHKFETEPQVHGYKKRWMNSKGRSVLE